VLAGPLGYLVRDRRRSLGLYLAAWAVIFPLQTVVVRDNGQLEWSYWVVSAAILALGVALNHAGRRLRARRARVVAT
jgi:hypothetical protein